MAPQSAPLDETIADLAVGVAAFSLKKRPSLEDCSHVHVLADGNESRA